MAMAVLTILLFAAATSVVRATLPPGCIPLEEHPLDLTDPGNIFGRTSIMGQKASPHRVGNLRQKAAIPTGHFMTNEIKSATEVWPLRLFPYEAIMKPEGIVYDAYTMDRWSNPDRTDTMQQQSAWVAGQTWNKLLNMGTNLKQMVSGPDGNPGGVFTGVSGVRVGIGGNAEPELQDFGDLYANFMYSNNGGTMEVPLVRGSPLLTHIFNNANPIITPFCLSNFNGQNLNFYCPKENTMIDAGSGHASATCSGSTLKIRLDNSKEIRDITQIEYAANSKSEWSNGRHAMHRCTTQVCRLSNGGKTLEVDIPNAHGEMAFAFNYIGHYVTPWNWIDKPATTTCYGKREATELETNKREVGDISFRASCDANRNLRIDIDISNNYIEGVHKVQYAVEPYNTWHHPPGMYNCQPGVCTRQGNVVTIKLHAPASHIRIAANVIGWITLPFVHPFKTPFEMTCGGPDIYGSKYGGSATQTGNPDTHTHPPTSKPHTQAPTSNPITPAPTSHPHTHVPTSYPYTQAPSHQTGQQQPITPGTKFAMELNEPGNDLPHQTRKFMVYFQHPVTPVINHGDNTISFSPKNGGTYNGFMQLAYLGAGPRGDHSNDTVLDQYLGVYSYKPKASYCVQNGRAFASFDWNANNQHAHQYPGNLLMVALPHHTEILKEHFSGNLKSTVYGFQGYEGPSWLLDMEAPRASMEPDPVGVQQIKSNTGHLNDIKAAIERDYAQANLQDYCAYADSYGVGKGIGMHARLASISRAFGTNHYHALDKKIKDCLEKWLRIDDILNEKLKFHYDTVWGGMFLSGTEGVPAFYTDFGFPFYNDHHFHLGYFFYALAYYVKHNIAWGNQHKSRIYALARDVGNPSYKDKFFPVVRHKDIYMGLSWATGVVPGERQEESSSEALNCYHGLAALGDAFNDPILRGTGQVMLALEIASVREYWHVRQHNFDHFPPAFQNYGVVGQIAEDSFYVYTLDWACAPNIFPMRHGCLVGIQIIPITAASKYWMDKDWAGHILKTCDYAINPSHAPDYSRADSNSLPQLETGWKAFCYAATAPYDAAHQNEAANYLKDKSPRDLVSGTGAASTLLFIYART